LEKERIKRPKARAVPGRRDGESQAERPSKERPTRKGRVGVWRVGKGRSGPGNRIFRILAAPPKKRKLKARVSTIDP
jgi:hypothetical protein